MCREKVSSVPSGQTQSPYTSPGHTHTHVHVYMGSHTDEEGRRPRSVAAHRDGRRDASLRDRQGNRLGGLRRAISQIIWKNAYRYHPDLGGGSQRFSHKALKPVGEKDPDPLSLPMSLANLL